MTKLSTRVKSALIEKLFVPNSDVNENACYRIAHKLLTDGSCIVAGKGRIFGSSSIGNVSNFITVTAADDCIDCVRLTLDHKELFSSVLFQSFITDYLFLLEAKKRDIDELYNEIKELKK